MPGCGPRRAEVGEVEGTVHLDGKPLEEVQVQFIPEDGALNAAGTSDASGKFTLRTDDGRNGAQVGQNRIVVQDLKRWKGIPLGRMGDTTPLPPGRFPNAYEDTGKTPLRQKVESGRQTVTVELKSKL